MKLAVLLAAALGFALTASAQNYSFTGTFTTDDQLQFFSFVPLTSAPTLLSLGYAGGVNAAGTTINAGGFDSYFSVFDSSGNLLAQDDDSRSVVDPVTGNAFDAEIADLGGLTAGMTYTLVLSESPNVPVDTFLADGFTEAGQGNYTCALYGLSPGPFCDASPTQRNGNWAVDILNVASATEPITSTPEPGSAALIGLGVGALVWLRRQRV